MSTFIGQLIGFAVIVFILWRYVVPPVKGLMQKQQDAVRTALAESAEAAKKLEDADADARQGAGERQGGVDARSPTRPSTTRSGSPSNWPSRPASTPNGSRPKAPNRFS